MMKTLLCEPAALARARGHVRVALNAGPRGTVLERLFQEGCGKLRVLRHGAGSGAELALINTAGGLTGGDHWQVALDLAAGAHASLTTPACEKLYRSSGGVAAVRTMLALGPGARLDWLPQESILYEGAAVERVLSLDLAEDADALVMEAVILGRLAMGERTRQAHFRDRIDIRRAGQWVLSERVALNDIDAARASPARLADADAYATLIHAAPDAISRLDEVRATLARLPGKAGVSAWNGLLVIRLLGYGSEPLRPALLQLLPILRPGSVPRLWQW